MSKIIDSDADMVLFCEWCGDELVDGNCPFCGWHSPLYDRFVAPAREERSKKKASDKNGTSAEDKTEQ